MPRTTSAPSARTLLIEQFCDRFSFSPRERDVLSRAAIGLSAKEIGASIGCATQTIHTYWRRITQKLNCRDRDEALAALLAFATDPTSTTPPRSPAPIRQQT